MSSPCRGKVGAQAARSSRTPEGDNLRKGPFCLPSFRNSGNVAGNQCCANLYPLCPQGAGSHLSTFPVGQQPGCDIESLHALPRDFVNISFSCWRPAGK